MSKENRSITDASSTAIAAGREKAFMPHWVSRPRPSLSIPRRRPMTRLPALRSPDGAVTATESGWRRSPTAMSAPSSTSPSSATS